LSCPH